MIVTKLTPLTESGFFEKLPQKVSTVVNFKQPKVGMVQNSQKIRPSESFNGELSGKIIQKAVPIKPFKNNLNPIMSNTQDVVIETKTDPFNGEVLGTTDSNINWNRIVMFSGLALVIGVAGYYVYKQWKKKNEEKSN